MEEEAEKYLFEKMPVPKAVATLAIPTIISQVVTMIYNLADTFFCRTDLLGRLGVGFGHRPWQCLQYGDGTSGRWLWRYSCSGLRCGKAYRPVPIECFHGTVSGIYAAGGV